MFNFSRVLGQAVLAAGIIAIPASAELLVNGGFETPTTGGYTTYNNGETIGGGFTVGQTSVDVVTQNFFFPSTAYEGTQYLDLNGTPGPGEIYQSFTTTPGAYYKLFFAYSNNPGGSPESAIVSVSNSTFTTTQVTHGGASNANLNWTTYSAIFQATGTSSTLDFLSPSGGNAGLLLDAVSVSGVPEPSSVLLMATMLGGLAFLMVRKQARS